jgi:hypothetical protein
MLNVRQVVLGWVWMSALVLSVMGYASGATYYTATNGSDAQSCAQATSQGAPMRTIIAGIACLQAGDTLYIRGGTYTEQLQGGVDLLWPSGTSWSSPITIAGFPGETAIIQPGPGCPYFVIGMDSGHVVQYLIFDNLTLDGANCGDSVVKIHLTAGYIRVQNSVIKNNLGNGFLVGGTGHNEFLHLNVFNTGLSDYGHGFYITSTSNLVDNSLIHDMHGYGVQVYQGADFVSANNNTVKNNKIWNTGQNGLGRSLNAMILSSGDNNVAYNNILWDNQGGIDVNYNAPNAKVYNNTIYHNTTHGGNCIAIAQANGAIFRNNICWQNGFDGIQNYDGSSITSDHNLFGVDPVFANVGIANFHLGSGSPAIGTGVIISLVSTDIDGNPRSTPYDIGAYVFATSQPTILPPANLRITNVVGN